MSTDYNPDDPRFEMLARAAQSVTVTPLNTASLVDMARTRRRRRRTAVGSALAVAVVVAGLTVASAASNPVLKNSVDASDTTEGPEPLPFPAPPSGMKWVGQNGLVVAVPAEWPVTENTCGSGAPAEVVDGALAAYLDCASPRGKTARVTLTSLTDDPEPPINRYCQRQRTTPTCGRGQIFPEQGIAVQVHVTGDDAEEQVNQILDSAMVLPKGWTTVPFAGESNLSERVVALEGAGFKVDVADSTLRDTLPVVVSPEFGSPLRAGATITLSPVGGTGTPDSSASTSAREMASLSRETLLAQVKGENDETPEEINAADRELDARSVPIKECPEALTFLMQPKIKELVLRVSKVTIDSDSVSYGGCPDVDELRDRFKSVEARIAAGNYQ